MAIASSVDCFVPFLTAIILCQNPEEAAMILLTSSFFVKIATLISLMRNE